MYAVYLCHWCMAGYKSIVHNRTVSDLIFEVKWIIEEASLSLVEETFISCSTSAMTFYLGT